MNKECKNCKTFHSCPTAYSRSGKGGHGSAVGILVYCGDYEAAENDSTPIDRDQQSLDSFMEELR